MEKKWGERERRRESRGILSSPRLLKTYTEMITSATTVSGGCVIYLRIPISTSLALMFLLPSVIALGFLYVVISRKLITLSNINFQRSYIRRRFSQILSSKTNIISNKSYAACERLSEIYSAAESIFNPRTCYF